MKNENNDWNKWNVLNDEEQITILNLILKHLKLIDPEIIKILVKDNNDNFEYFKEILTKNNVKTDIYLWENSSVMFPGIRRHVGQKEIAKFKKDRGAKSKNALKIDDNTYPKMIWSFIMTGEKFSVNNAPKDYSLAHVIDHKDYRHKRGVDIKNYKVSKIENSYAGMYTSAVNTVYINNSLMKPTDFNGNVRKVLIKILKETYSSVCDILPYNDELNTDGLDLNWDINKLTFPNFVGDVNNVINFINYRKSFYQKYE